MALRSYFLLLLATTCIDSSTLKSYPHQQPQQPNRPTRTLNLFGSSKPNPVPPQPAPPPLVPVSEQQKSIPNSVPQQHLQFPQQQVNNPRPLVYQVKYYDRVQNNLIDIPDGRNYQPIDKAGVAVGLDHQPQVVNVGGTVYGGVPVAPQQQQPQSVYFGQQSIPQRYYYNPLIPPQVPEPSVFYTLANIGNTQVLVPCTSPTANDLYYDSTIQLNVNDQVVQKPYVVSQQQQQQQVVSHQPPAISTSPQPQRTPLTPPSTLQQPLVRDQVIAAAQELSHTLPGSGIVSANINTSPYTQGSYFYYYTLPYNYDRVVPTSYYNNVYRFTSPTTTNGVGVGGVPHPQVQPYYPFVFNYPSVTTGTAGSNVLPAQSHQVPVRTLVPQNGQAVPQNVVSQQQQQHQPQQPQQQTSQKG